MNYALYSLDELFRYADIVLMSDGVLYSKSLSASSRTMIYVSLNDIFFFSTISDTLFVIPITICTPLLYINMNIIICIYLSNLSCYYLRSTPPTDNKILNF